MKLWVLFARMVCVLALLIATTSPTWGQVRRGPAPRSKARPSQPARNTAKAKGALSEAECRAFADTVAKAIATGDQAKLNGLIDWDAFFKRISMGWDIPAKASQDTLSGLKEGMQQPTGVTGQLIQNSKQGGSFSFLRTRQNHGRQVILFRMLKPSSEGGFNYMELVPQRSADGEVRMSDIYVYLSGEFLSATLRRALLPIISSGSRTFLDKLLTGEKDYVKDFPKWTQATQLLNQGKFKEALTILKALSPETQQQKLVLLMRLRAAQAVDEKEYGEVLEDFEKFFPHDACLDLISIDSYVLKKDFAGAMKAIDRVDRSLDGDPYLNVMRANMCEAQGNLQEAKRLAQKAVDQEPTLLLAHQSVLGYAVALKDHDETLAQLKSLDQTFQMTFNDLTKIPAYSDFVKSPQYQKWLDYLKKKGQPAKPSRNQKPARPKGRPSRPGTTRSGGGG